MEEHDLLWAIADVEGWKSISERLGKNIATIDRLLKEADEVYNKYFK
jgi:hypothetical protein